MMPSGMIFLCLFLGFFIWPLRRRRNFARTLFFLAFFIYGTAGNTLVANFLIWSLERSAESQESTIVNNKAVTSVVMLCGGASNEECRQMLDCLTPYTRLRLLKSRELCRENPAIKRLLIVGGCARPFGECKLSEAKIAYQCLRELGLGNSISVSLEENSRDTEENMKAIRQIMGQDPFYLVTSAAHMPRVLMLANILDLKIQPVPCNFQWSQNRWTLWDFWPNPLNLGKTDMVCHEYLGIAWLQLKQHLNKLQRFRSSASLPKIVKG